MRILIMTAIMALPLMALGQTEPQQTTQGQTKETQAKTSKRKSMKAIRVHEFGGPEVLRLEEVPTPQPGPGQVLVRMHAVGVNPVETYIRAGTYAYKPTLPYTPGNDGAGVVEQVGTDVNEFKPGDRVYTARSVSGTYAEFALCTTEQVHPLPANVSFGQGAAMGTPYATAYRAGGWSGKQDVASGDRQRISASRSGRGTSSRHGAGSVGENRASAKEVGRKNEEGGIRKEELKMGRKTKNCVSPASTALDHYLASDLPTPNATAWQAT